MTLFPGSHSMPLNRLRTRLRVKRVVLLLKEGGRRFHRLNSLLTICHVGISVWLVFFFGSCVFSVCCCC